MKRILIGLLVLVSIGCNRWQFLDAYSVRPDCWQTYVMEYESGRIDTTRYRIPCPEQRYPGQKLVEPEWKYSKQ